MDDILYTWLEVQGSSLDNMDYHGISGEWCFVIGGIFDNF